MCNSLHNRYNNVRHYIFQEQERASLTACAILILVLSEAYIPPPPALS